MSFGLTARRFNIVATGSGPGIRALHVLEAILFPVSGNFADSNARSV